MDFHFLHAADIHLDSPLRGLSAYEGAPVERFRDATRQAFTNLVNHAIETGAAFVVIAGDLYDGDWPDFGTGLFLVKELTRLHSAGIRTAILFGNHDAHSKMTKGLPWPDTAIRFNHKKPQSVPFDDLGVVLHGQSFERMDVTANLAAGYPAPVAGRLNIGVLHTALEGNARHASYAPCSLDQLRGHGYDYWALGHVHGQEIVHRAPWIVFPGNLQGRHIRETGAKGCVSVSVRDGKIVDVTPVILDAARWILAEVDATGLDERERLRARCVATARDAIAERADGLPAAVRIRVIGETALHGALIGGADAFENELRAELMGDDCWLERVKIATTPLAARDTAAAREASSLLAHLLSDAATDPGLRAGLEEALRPLLEKLPADLVRNPNPDEAEDAPLLAALGAGRLADILAAVLPDLLAINGEA